MRKHEREQRVTSSCHAVTWSEPTRQMALTNSSTTMSGCRAATAQQTAQPRTAALHHRHGTISCNATNGNAATSNNVAWTAEVDSGMNAACLGLEFSTDRVPLRTNRSCLQSRCPSLGTNRWPCAGTTRTGGMLHSLAMLGAAAANAIVRQPGRCLRNERQRSEQPAWQSDT
jgi:hypothetical protein